MKKNKRTRTLPAAAVLAIDFLLFLAALPLFALFHHVIAYPMNGDYGTVPMTKEAPDWSEKFAAHFAPEGTVETGDTFYRDSSLSIEVTRGEKDGAVYHLADVYISDPTRLKTAFAGGAFSRGVADSVVNMARENGAVFAVSGDYCGIRERGIVIRNGVVYRKTKAHQIGALFYDGVFKTYPFSVFRVESAIESGAWQVWDFGPELLQDGRAITEFSTGISGPNPRMAFGYFEPGHYCFIAVDGRQAQSKGLTLVQLAALFEEIGCRTAYNLDGGHSAVMILNGKIVNSPSAPGGRDISDIIYFPAQAEQEQGAL